MASELTVQTLRGPTSGANADTVLIPSGQTLHAPGHVIQVVQGVESGAPSYSVGSSSLSSAILSVSITPKLSTSKILISGQITGSSDSNAHAFWIAIHRGSTDVGHGQTDGNRKIVHSGIAQMLYNGSGGNGAGNGTEALGNGSIHFLDSPNTTSEITYNIKLAHNSGGAQTWHMNRTDADGNTADRPRAMSGITLMEIAQ
jgi:hypothetical protein